MTGQAITDEMLMAYADGELDAGGRAAVAAAVAADPALAGRLAMFAQTRAALRDAFPADPVPDALAGRIRSMAASSQPAAQVIPMPSPTAPSPPRAVWRPAAIAAALALAVGLGAGWFAARQGAGGAAVAALDPAVLAALATLPSGSEAAAPGGMIRAVASFTDRDGTLCREMEEETTEAARLIVACRAGADWALRLALVTPASGTGYAPVGALEAVEAWMASAGASAPLTPEAEAAALGR